MSHQRRDQDRPNALERLVQTREQANALKGPAGGVVVYRLVVVAVCGEGDDGAVEGLEPKLVGHDAEDVDHDISAFLGREFLETPPQLREVTHRTMEGALLGFVKLVVSKCENSTGTSRSRGSGEPG